MFLWKTEFIWNRFFSNNVKVFTVTFDQLNASLFNKSIFQKKDKTHTDPKLLNEDTT